MTQTLLFVHAHPDDEALLTAGTMARAHAEGHRVILLVATDGAAGLTSTDYAHELGATRSNELMNSASALGVDKVITWNLPDSGLHGENTDGFAHHDIKQLAGDLLTVIDQEGVTVVVGYDQQGGYGHPDHLQVHNVVRAAYAAGKFELFEATLPREPIARAVRLAETLKLTPDAFCAEEFAQAWTPHSEITHRVNVRPYVSAKKSAIRAHASQAHADGTVRTLGVLSALPTPLFAALLGTEYYVKV